MWQRKQTLFLIGSLIAVILCLLLRIGSISVSPTGLGDNSYLTNLGWSGQAIDSLPAWVFFILMTIVGILSIAAIFLYHNRRLQMKLCSFAMLADFLWYVYYIVFFFGLQGMHICFAACLPLVSCILLFLAKKGIKADDDLVRSADRIR